MPLEEYGRKRSFGHTPEPPPQVAARPGHRFVVQKHRASRLHYDFRLELAGVLKSWAVPKGPSLDPAEKRLAMMVEDHPVSYFHFEGIIPPGNYGAGTVMVWDTGLWEPLTPEGTLPKKLTAVERDRRAAEMLEKGDFKFRLSGRKLSGDFVLARMRSRRPGSKGTEWLLIKKRDAHVVAGYDAEQFDASALSGRSLAQIAADRESAQWLSRPAPARAGSRNAWLADSIAKRFAAQRANAGNAAAAGKSKPKAKPQAQKNPALREDSPENGFSTRSPAAAVKVAALASVKGAVRAAMPRTIPPMLATLGEAPFDDPAWLFEIKWDGYRALAAVERGRLRLVSRGQNEFTGYAELAAIADSVRAQTAILDGEIVALDSHGRPSFGLMQQRNRTRAGQGARIPLVYCAFDLLYLEGWSLVKVALEKRKELLRQIVVDSPVLRYSDHFLERGVALYTAARERGLEGIVAKRRASAYHSRRSRDWLKLKITAQQECVIGGYTEPQGARPHFGSLVLGLYDEKRRLIPVGQAGSGFTARSQAEMWRALQPLASARSPFFGEPESPRSIHWVRPALVAEIRFAAWTHEGASGAIRMRAPVFLGLRRDKKPEECVFEFPRPASAAGKAAGRER